jgi:hypothetical protein
MLRKASTIRYYDDEQVAEIVDKALALARRDDVPEQLAGVVFVQACGLYAQQHTEFEQVTLAGGGMAIPRRGNGR